MFADIHFIDFLRANPALAVFVTLALGFLVGKLRWRSFSLGTVTSVLLVGVVVGQLKIEIPEPAKTLFFLLFLFSVGYAVGPQFFRGLKRDGLPQVGFAVVVCLLCLGSTWLCATLMGYDVAQAAGLLAGSQTMSAVLGVATDTIRQLLSLGGGTASLNEILLPENFAFAGKSIKDIPIPGNAILVSITRDTEFIIPHGNTVLLPWDRILCLTQDDTLHLLTEAWGLTGK